MPSQPRVFLSHALADAELTRRLASEMRRSGIDVQTIDDIPAGAKVSAVQAALDAADIYVVVVSKDSGHSPQARFELSEALKRCWDDPGKRVVPVVVGEAELPGALRDRQALHIDPEESANLRRLLEARDPPSASDSLSAAASGQRVLDRLDEIYTAASRHAAQEGDE